MEFAFNRRGGRQALARGFGLCLNYLDEIIATFVVVRCDLRRIGCVFGFGLAPVRKHQFWLFGDCRVVHVCHWLSLLFQMDRGPSSHAG